MGLAPVLAGRCAVQVHLQGCCGVTRPHVCLHADTSDVLLCPADVPAITGALLVKSVPPSNLDATTENLFAGLIPDSR